MLSNLINVMSGFLSRFHSNIIALLPPAVDVRIYIAMSLGLMAVASNLLIVSVYIQTWQLGGSITEGRLEYVDDGDIITLVGVWATLLQSITALLGGWALSQKWSRELIDDTQKCQASFIGLQSIGIFGSLGTLLKTVYSLIRRRYPTGTAVVTLILLVLSAAVLQLYSAAVTTLAVPILWGTTNKTSYPILDTFMADPVSGTLCVGAPKDKQYSCLEEWYIGNAISNILLFNSRSAAPHVGEVVGYPWPWEPKYRDDYASGYRKFVLVCDNHAVTQGIMNLPALYDSSATYVAGRAPASAPILSCQCALTHRASPTSLNIAGVEYRIPTPIVPVTEGSIAAQVTVNNLSLIISYPTTSTSSNIHCAVNLSIVEPPLGWVDFYNPLRNVGQLNGVAYAESGVDHSAIFSSAFQVDITRFTDVWLKAMGWSAKPTQSTVSQVLSNLHTSTETSINISDSNPDPTRFSLEAYSMIMMGDAVSQGFPTFIGELGGNSTQQAEQQEFEYTVQQYYLGARTATRKLSCAVLVLDSVIVVWCLWTITAGGGWKPDWSDPVALACTAIASPPVQVCERNSGGDLKEEVWVSSLRARTDGEGAYIFEERGASASATTY